MFRELCVVLVCVVGVCTGCDPEGNDTCYEAFYDSVMAKRDRGRSVCGVLDTLTTCVGSALVGCPESDIDYEREMLEFFNQIYECSATLVVPTSHTDSPTGKATRQAGITATPRATANVTTVTSSVATVSSGVATVASGVATVSIGVATVASGVVGSMSGSGWAVAVLSSAVMAVIEGHLS